MNETSKILDTLKKYLKAKGITYRELGEKLELSESTIKRLFSEESISLKRLESICDVLELEFYELAKMSKNRDGENSEILSIEQERHLANHPKLLMFFYLIISGWPVSLISEEYEFTQLEISKFLLELDQLGVIELHSNNRVRLIVSQNVFWRKDGPLWKIYESRVRNEFLNYPFNLSNERLTFGTGKLSENSFKIILREIDKLSRRYNELADMDSSLPISGRYSTGLMIAFRPWVLSIISELRRK